MFFSLSLSSFSHLFLRIVSQLVYLNLDGLSKITQPPLKVVQAVCSIEVNSKKTQKTIAR